MSIKHEYTLYYSEMILLFFIYLRYDRYTHKSKCELIDKP